MSLECDLNFIKDASIIELTRPININKIKKIIPQIKSDKILFILKNEIPIRIESNFTDFLNFLEDEVDKEIKVSVSTLNSFRFSTHPLTNFITYSISSIEENPFDDLSNSLTRRSELFNPNIFYKNKKLDLTNKTVKGILNSRRVSDNRNKIFTFAEESNFDGILRYIKWNHDLTFEFEYKNNFPNWHDLLNDYEKSFVSFILETDNTIAKNKCQLLYDLVPFSEKTVIPFMTFSIPIIFGEPYIVEKLTSLGFWIGNDDFGFGSGDLEINKDKKIQRYLKCIEKYNSLSINDIKNYYIDNQEKIQKNYDLIKSIICNDNSNYLMKTAYII
jgi:hypothetical protein